MAVRAYGISGAKPRSWTFSIAVGMAVIGAILIFSPTKGAAQAPDPRLLLPGAQPEGEVTPEPLCANLINRSAVNLRGSINSAPQTLPDGTSARHTANFTLKPAERTQICSSGPFYEGRRVELVLRSLFPLFSCKTALSSEINLYVDEIDGRKRYSATCT